MTAIEAYAAPTTVKEAVELLAGGTATVFAGGTDLMIQTRVGAKAFDSLLLNLRRITEMRGITRAGGVIRLGALTTVTDVLRDSELQQSAPILPETADRFACGQVRNNATIGGNICNASPAGDMIIPLLLLDADVELACWVEGAVTTRLVRLCDFFVGPGQTVIQPTEILTAVVFPVPAADFVAGFRKFGTRPSMDIAVVSVGIGGRLRCGALSDSRVAFGAVAPVPLRGRETEAAIEGQVLDAATIANAAERSAGEVSPISDVRASAWYRRELIRTLTGRQLQDVAQTGD